MTPKNSYRMLCLNEPTIPIFSRDWWLDAVCGDAWDVCVVEKGGRIVATMPYHFKKRFGQLLIVHPHLTQTLGPWLLPSSVKYSNKLGQEKDLLEELIYQLPAFKYFNQSWCHINTNWLPFYWNGFNQTTKYTYILPQLSDTRSVWSGFKGNIKSDIRKAVDRFKLKVRHDLTIDDFIILNNQTFDRKNMKPPYSNEFIRRLDRACLANNARRILIAEDENGQRHAGVYIIWDEQSAYYLMGGGDPKLRSSGATSLCIWEAIKFSATLTKSFDFEGSMIEPVERFFRAFGAIQTPYFSVHKSSSKYLMFAKCMRDIILE